MGALTKQLRQRLEGVLGELEKKQGSAELIPIYAAAIKDLTISLSLAVEKSL